jgi:hypothetical protein
MVCGRHVRADLVRGDRRCFVYLDVAGIRREIQAQRERRDVPFGLKLERAAAVAAAASQ